MHAQHDKEIHFRDPVLISNEAQPSGETEEQRVMKWVAACCEPAQRAKMGTSSTVRHSVTCGLVHLGRHQYITLTRYVITVASSLDFGPQRLTPSQRW